MTQTLTTIEPPAMMNGYPILAARPLPYGGGILPGHVALCEGKDGEYVTWVIYEQEHGRGWAATWGHYFHPLDGGGDALTRAVEDYLTR